MSYRAMTNARQLLASIPASHVPDAATQQVIVTAIAELDAAIEEHTHRPLSDFPPIPDYAGRLNRFVHELREAAQMGVVS